MKPVRSLLRSSLVLGLAAAMSVAYSQTQSYIQKTLNIRAGVVGLSADNGLSATPFAFYNLDRASDIKPGGWSLSNPHAPGTVTATIQSRYGTTALLNAPISKRNAAYWTVPVNELTETQLADYDVLLIAPRARLSLTPIERERLRRFVDGGGVLWVEVGTAITDFDQANNLPVAFHAVTTNATNVNRDRSNPLLNGVRSVTDGDIALLNSGSTLIMAPVTGLDTNIFSSLAWEFLRYRPVVTVGNGMAMSTASLGDGFIVVTTRGAAAFLNGASGTNYNSLDNVTDPNFPATTRAAARLSANIIGLGGGYHQPGGGSRKQGSDRFDPGSPVLSRFLAEGTYGPQNALSGSVVSAPVTHKGLLVATVSNGGTSRVVVFDPVPGRDLDGDGDPDDGIAGGNAALLRDYSLGQAMDVVWYSAPISGVASSPVCAEVPEATDSRLVDQILVTDSSGTLHSFPLTTRTATQQIIGGEIAELYAVAPPGGGGAFVQDDVTNVARVNAPTVQGGLAIIADATSLDSNPQGRVWIVDLSTGARFRSTNDWYLAGNASGQPLPASTASPTVGFIPISDGSGGSDRVIYVPGYAGNNKQPGFVSLWLGAKGEKPTEVTVSGTTLQITTRAASASALPIYFPGGSPSRIARSFAPKITLLDANGNALTAVQTGNYISGAPSESSPGVLNYTLNDPAGFTANNIQVRIDYAVDWGRNSNGQTTGIERGRLLLPVPTNSAVAITNRRILGSIALTPRGTLHLVEGVSSRVKDLGSSYFAIREDAGRGRFRVVSRFTVHQTYNQVFTAGGSSVAVPACLSDVDGVQNFLPAFIRNAALTNFRFAGSPTIRNGVAYVTVNADRGLLPLSAVLALRAEPEVPELRLGSSIPSNPNLLQTDLARSNGSSLVNSRLGSDRLTVDTENGVIRIENLASVQSGQITDCLSLSQPIGIGGDGRSYTLRQPDAAGDRWSPLLWYGIWNGATGNGAPLVAGNQLFIAAQTVLPTLISSGFTNFTTNSMVVWSIDADISPSGVYVATVPNRPWLVQACQINNANTDPNSIQVSPYFRMPQTQGISSFEDWVVRLNQSVAGSSNVAYGVSGGNGTVVAYGNNGFAGMSRAEFVICDEGRLLKVDSSGNPISNTFGSRFSGIGNGSGASNHKPLVRPVRAYPINDSEYLVVDAGANRVVRMDDDGTEVRAIDRLMVDRDHKPAGILANEPLELKDPRDAFTFEGFVSRGATDVVTDQQPLEYWVRYVIADAGNGRIIELVDRYSVEPTTYAIGAPRLVDGTPQVGVLTWKSPKLQAISNLGDYYNSVSRVFVGNPSTDGRYVYVAGVGRTSPTVTSSGLDNPNGPRPSATGGGAVVLFDPIGGARVITRYIRPDLTGTPFTDLATGNPSTANQTLSTPGGEYRFTGLSSVTATSTVNGGTAVLRLMVSDASGVYEFNLPSASLLQTAELTPTATWFINEGAYTRLTTASGYGDNARYFRPSYARRLDSGDVMVVNGYTGQTRSGSPYGGEVMLLRGGADNVALSGQFGVGKLNLGFRLNSIQFKLSTFTGVRGVLSPIFADRR